MDAYIRAAIAQVRELADVGIGAPIGRRNEKSPGLPLTKKRLSPFQREIDVGAHIFTPEAIEEAGFIHRKQRLSADRSK